MNMQTLFVRLLKRVLIALGACSLLGACPAGPPSEVDGGATDAGSGHDAATDAGSGHDAAIDAGAGQDAAIAECRQEMLIDQPIEIDPEGYGSTCCADAVFDGHGMWVAYSRRNANRDFDVYLTQLGCDGLARVAPRKVNTTLTGSHLSPCVVLVDGGLVVAWVADNETGENNWDVFYRTFDRTGAPTLATDRALETSYLGNPVAGSVLDQSVAPLPGGAFAIAAVRSLAAASAFQVFVQRLTASGEFDGTALDVVIEHRVSHGQPSLAATSSGDLYLSYIANLPSGAVSLAHSHLPAGSTTWDPLPPAVVANTDTSSYAVDTGDGRLLLAYDSSTEIFVRDGSVFTPTSRTLSLGTGGGARGVLRLVLAPGGGSVFYRRLQGTSEIAFRVASFVDDGTALIAGRDRAVTASPVVYDRLAATHVDGTVYFAAWSEAADPDFVLRGKFIDLAP